MSLLHLNRFFTKTKLIFFSKINFLLGHKFLREKCWNTQKPRLWFITRVKYASRAAKIGDKNPIQVSTNLWIFRIINGLTLTETNEISENESLKCPVFVPPRRDQRLSADKCISLSAKQMETRIILGKTLILLSFVHSDVSMYNQVPQGKFSSFRSL